MSNEIQLKFGSLSFSGDITIGKISIREGKNVKTYNIPKTDGSIAETARRNKLVIEIEGDIIGTNYDNLRSNLDSLRGYFQDGLQKFTTDDDRYVIGQLDSFDYEFVTLRTSIKYRASFIVHYPFWISETESTDTRTPTSGTGYTITNSGNAPCRVKIEVTAPAGGIADACKLENVTRSEAFQYRGTIAAATVLEVDNRYDTDDFEVKNAGVGDFANYEGDFIWLDPGDNEIKYTGTAGASVKLYWRDTWY